MCLRACVLDSAALTLFQGLWDCLKRHKDLDFCSGSFFCVHARAVGTEVWCHVWGLSSRLRTETKS